MTEITANIERADGAPPPTPGASATAAVPLGQLLAGFCVIVAVWLIAASRWVWTDTVVPWDSKNQFYAFFRFLASALHSGASPFWNPYHYGGHPSVADPQSLVLAPAFLLWAPFDPAPSLRAFALIVYAHLLAGGPSLWLCRRGGRAPGVAPVLLAGPVLLTLQFAAMSNRPAETYETAVKSSLHPLHLAQVAVADLFVTNKQYWGPGPWSIPELPYIDDSFSYMFVGSVAVVLLLWFGVAGGRLFRRGRILLAGILVLAVLYALGRYTPVFGWAYDWVPGIAKFRRPVDAIFVFVAALALLCGHLLAGYMREGLPRRRVLASIAVGGCALGMLAWGLMFLTRSGHVLNGLTEIAKAA